MVEPVEADDDAIHDGSDEHEELDQVADTTPEGEPEYGERITEDKPKNALRRTRLPTNKYPGMPVREGGSR